MKKIKTTIILFIVLLTTIVVHSTSAQFTNQFVDTKEAHDITRTSAVIALQLSDQNFTKHGFAFKSLSDGLAGGPGTGLTKSQIGNCIPNINPSSDNPYTQNLYRELTKQNLTEGEIYYYYGCGLTNDGKTLEGEIQTFSTLAGACSIQSVKFGPLMGAGDDFEERQTIVTIQTKGDCSSGINLNLFAFDDTPQRKKILNKIDGIPGIFYPNKVTGILKIKLETEESTCYGNNNEDGGSGNWGYECIAFLTLDNSSGLLFDGSVPELTPENVKGNNSLRERGVIVGNCSGACGSGNSGQNDGDNWDFLEVLEGSTADSSQCEILESDISFSNLGKIISNKNPRLKINTTGCEGVRLRLTLVDTTYQNEPIKINSGQNSAGSFEFIPKGNEVVFSFNSTDYNCSFSKTPDCQIYVAIVTPNGLVRTIDALDDHIENWENLEHLKDGVILADCESPQCKTLVQTILSNNVIGLQLGLLGAFNAEYWTLESATGIFNDELNNPLNIEFLEQSFDQDSPCYVEPGGILGPSGKTAGDKGGYKEDCYELLAPIPGIGEDVKNNGRFSIDFSSYQLGQYIQSIFNVALGLLMLLSVIMIIVAGVEYMTVESIFGKSKAKSRITGATTGLILGLGIFIILRTINPQLLEINFGSNVETKTIGFQLAEHSGAGIKPASGADVPESARDTNSRDKRAIKPEWAIVNGKVVQLTGDEGIKEVRACDEDNMEKVTAFGKSFYVNKYVKESLLKVNAKWEASKGTNDFYEVPGSKSDADAMGSYVCRKTSQGGISYHSYGLSVDINPTKNPQGSVLKTDMPESFINFWKEEGWGWGGDWSSSKDAMHFSKIKSEGGDQKY